jgi:hypothetical protein
VVRDEKWKTVSRDDRDEGLGSIGQVVWWLDGTSLRISSGERGRCVSGTSGL